MANGYPTNSTGGRGQQGQSDPGTPAYLWRVAGKSVAVRVHVDVAERLEREATDVLRSLTTRGSEIGGLLLGTVRPGNPAWVTLSDYELIPCDYERSSLYELGNAEARRFDEAIAARSSSIDRIRVVGFFRSQTRRRIALSADDIAFCKARFGGPHQIAMLVRPGGAQPSRGGIFIWEDGVMQGESSYLEFPLSRGELMKQGLVTYLPAVEPAFEADATEAAGHPSAPEPAKRAQIVPIVSRREPARIVPTAAGARMETAGAPAVNLPDATAVPAAVRT